MQQIQISDALWARMQTYGTTLIDTPETVLIRVFDHWDKTGGPGQHVTIKVPETEPPKFFRTTRGVELPIGLKMFADWNGNKLQARVTASGIEHGGATYADPSGAAKAAKLALGATSTQASTNGWEFWMMDAPGVANRICAIDRFRQKK